MLSWSEYLFSLSNRWLCPCWCALHFLNVSGAFGGGVLRRAGSLACNQQRNQSKIHGNAPTNLCYQGCQPYADQQASLLCQLIHLHLSSLRASVMQVCANRAPLPLEERPAGPLTHDLCAAKASGRVEQRTRATAKLKSGARAGAGDGSGRSRGGPQRRH